MERSKLIERIRKFVDIYYEKFKDNVVNNNMEDYCDEMALMYNFRKYLQYITDNEDEISNKDLEILIENEDDIDNNFVDNFLEIYWNSDYGNSYYDIKKVLDELIREYKVRGE